EAHYAQYMALYADLSRSFAGQPSAAEQPTGPRPGPASPEAVREVSAPASVRRLPGAKPRRRFLWQAAAGLGALAAGVLLTLALWPRPRAYVQQVVPEAEPSDNTVAVLLQAPGAVWEGKDVSPQAGGPLAPGWLRLKSGLAQIEFYSGATVFLEGPAELRLISRSEAYCARGRLRAVVPPQAPG